MASKAEQDWAAFLRYKSPVGITRTPNSIEFAQWVTSTTGMSLFFSALPFLAVGGLIVVFFLIAAHERAGWYALPLDIAALALLVGLYRKAVIRIQSLSIEPGQVVFKRGDGTSPLMRITKFVIQFAGLTLASWAIISLVQHLNRYFRDIRGQFDWDRMMGHPETIVVGIMILGVVSLYVLFLWLLGRYMRGRGTSRPRNTLVIPVDEIRSIDVRTGGSFESQDISIHLHTVVIWHGPHAVGTISAGNYDTAIALMEGVVAAIGVMNQSESLGEFAE